MKKYIYIFGSIAIVILLPLIFKRSNLSLPSQADDTLVIITPHNEAIRLEMDLGFREWYKQKTGRTVAIDWRVPGSTGDIIRYVNAIFVNAFRVYWENTLGEKWNAEVQENFVLPKPKTDFGKKVRRCFLSSNVGCGIDLFFGGGVVEHRNEAEMGQFVPSGIIEKHPEWFCEDCIPPTLCGDFLWDPRGCWIGSSVSSFGIMYNTDRIRDLQLPHPPTQWVDLTSPKFFRQIAMVDPMQSSIVIKCLEMIFQQQMQQIRSAILEETQQEELTDAQLHAVLNEGWMRGLKIIQKIMANSRYFTDNSVTTVWDVCLGNCAVGVVVDFYGRHQREVTLTRGGTDRLRFVLPKGGTCTSPDPISLFRGAPHPEVARAFIEYIVSEEGQDRIGFKINVPHGPQYYALHRTPLRKDFYTEAKKPFMSSPEMNPFLGDDFPYQTQWTAPAFRAIRALAKVLFMDPFTELSQAWQAIIEAQEGGRTEQAQRALAVFSDLDEISYDWIFAELLPKLKSKDALSKIQAETELTKKYRQRYLEAYRIATQR